MIIFLRKQIKKKELAQNGTAIPRLTDPYEIAYLRKGEVETIKVITVSLIDRKLLLYENDNLSVLDPVSIELVHRPIEKAVLKCFEQPAHCFEVFQDANIRNACNDYKNKLLQQKLIADKSTFQDRLLGILRTLGMITLTSILYAHFAYPSISEGLVVIGVIIFCFGIILFKLYRKRLTTKGEKALADLRFLFGRLHSRAKFLTPGGNTNEVALVAAIFGLQVLPPKSFPFVNKLYLSHSVEVKAGASDACDVSSSCGSSCGGGCGGCGS